MGRGAHGEGDEWRGDGCEGVEGGEGGDLLFQSGYLLMKGLRGRLIHYQSCLSLALCNKNVVVWTSGRDKKGSGEKQEMETKVRDARYLDKCMIASSLVVFLCLSFSFCWSWYGFSSTPCSPSRWVRGPSPPPLRRCHLARVYTRIPSARVRDWT